MTALVEYVMEMNPYPVACPMEAHQGIRYVFLLLLLLLCIDA